MAQEGLEPSASLGLSESGLPIAYRAANRCTQYPGWESNPQAPGFKPGRSAVGVPGPFKAEAVGLEPTSGDYAATCFQDRPLIRPDDFREGLNQSSGGWNRTSGLRVQSAASRPAATAPEFGKEDSNLHAPASKAGGLPLADSRERHARVELACPVWKTSAWTARPMTRSDTEAEGEGVEPSRLIARPVSSRVPSPFGLPFRIVELRRQESNLRPPG
jgi:hypothetical protein